MEPPVAARRPRDVTPGVAVIDEHTCIGCALCLEACPVDAIVGAPRLMHTVIAAECIGCRLCLPPCPVNCIVMVEAGAPLAREARKQRAGQARMRYANRVARRSREESRSTAPVNAVERRKREAVESAIERARERLLARAKK
jgi:electron transport complex protein RnfB